ncbi:MAG TPA: glycosyltransferase [Gemmatimonadaceae bacterium]|nr:glycosyltransferase [Gemmatimonadaceae bacterium]
MISSLGPMWSLETASTDSARTPAENRGQPGISIIVTSSNGAIHLRRCLERFCSCWFEARAEVIVVHAGAASEVSSLPQEFANVTWLGTESGVRQTDLRRMGFERSSRDIVLFIDDRETERHEWAATLCRNWLAWADIGGRVINAPTCGAEGDQSVPYPYISVVMPVRDGGPGLTLALQALALSDLPRQAWELVVVDDGSADDTAAVAAQYADKLLRLRAGARGPGYARNRGYELTLGECIAFVNADVMVETNTLRNSLTVLSDNPDIGAVFGVCDASSTTSGFLSDYRSLVQRYYRGKDADDACMFSSACGIIRSSVFERAGGYNEWHFSRRQLEELEIGQRIRALGQRITLHPSIEATHLRKWTVRRMVATEIFDRAVPWMRLTKRQLTQDRGGGRAARAAKHVNIAVSWLGALCAALAWSMHSPPLSLAALGCIVTVLVIGAPRFAFFGRERGIGFAAVSLPVDLLYYLAAGVGVLFGWIARQAIGDPTPGAVAEAFAEMGVKRWPPVPVKRVARPSLFSSVVAGASIGPRSSGVADFGFPAPESATGQHDADSSQAIS